MNNTLVDFSEFPLPAAAGGDVISAQELLVLQLVSRGYTDEQIAAVLGYPHASAESLISSATKHLGCTTRSEAVDGALQHDLIL